MPGFAVQWRIRSLRWSTARRVRWPEFQPNDDLRRALSWLLGQDIHPAVAWLLLFVNGAVIWGFLFGQVYRLLPGKHPWQKGVFFGICVWIVMGFVFFPLVDRGLFAIDLGLGPAPVSA